MRIVALSLAVSLALSSASHAATYLDIPLSNVRDHAFTATGDLLLTSGNNLLVLSAQDCRLRMRFQGPAPLFGVDVSVDDDLIAVAAQGLHNGAVGFFYNIDQKPGFPRHEDLPYFQETGSFMPLWTRHFTVLYTGTGTSTIPMPLREADLLSPSVEHRLVRPRTMLARASKTDLVALAQPGIIAGPVHLHDTVTGTEVAHREVLQYVYEVALDHLAHRMAVPTYSGTFILQRQGNQLVPVGRLGAHASHGPVAAVFSADGSRLVTANYSFNFPSRRGLHVVDATTLQTLHVVDPIRFAWSGNVALGEGRMTLDPSGHQLAVTTFFGVRLYNVGRELQPNDRQRQTCATRPLSEAPMITSGSAGTASAFDAWGWPIGENPEALRND